MKFSAKLAQEARPQFHGPFESDERERKRKGKALAQRLASSTDDQ
jgi:hypothetical protein